MYITNRSFNPFSSYMQHNVNEANNTGKETCVRDEVLSFIEDMEARANFEAGTNFEPTSRLGNWLLNAAAVATLPITLAFKFVEKYPMASVLTVLTTQVVGIAAASVGTQSDADKTNDLDTKQADASELLSSRALHSSTMSMAAEAIKQGESYFTAVAAFNDKNCTDQAKITIFANAANGTQEGNIKWERCLDGDNHCGMIANLTKPQFNRAVGYAAGIGRNCVTALSVDPISLLNMKKDIHRQAANREKYATLFPTKNSNTTCIPKPTFKNTILSNSGQRVPIFQEVECRPVTVTYKRPTQEIVQSYLGKLASVLCIDRLAVISDGIEGGDVVDSVNSTSVFTQEPIADENGVSSMKTVNGSLPLSNSAMGSKFARSTLARCHDLALDDVRGSQDIITTENGAQYSTNALSLSSVIQSLSQVLDMESNGLPTAVILLDVHEIGNYHPDVMLVESLVSKLREKGVEVYAYASSAGSWLSRIQGMKVTSKVSEIVAKTVKIKRLPAPASHDASTDWQGNTKSALSFGLVTFAATLVGLGLLCWCKKDKDTNASERVDAMPSESVPLQALNKTVAQSRFFRGESSNRS